jgi:hypothetical protein
LPLFKQKQRTPEGKSKAGIKSISSGFALSTNLSNLGSVKQKSIARGRAMLLSKGQLIL